jgi:hypothetical protein
VDENDHIQVSTELIDLCLDALDTFGPMVQSGKCIEEMGECIQELFRMMQYEHDPVNMQGEIVDCMITLLQMQLSLDSTNFNETVIEKMGKLRRAIEQHKLDKQKSN